MEALIPLILAHPKAPHVVAIMSRLWNLANENPDADVIVLPWVVSDEDKAEAREVLTFLAEILDANSPAGAKPRHAVIETPGCIQFHMERFAL